MKQSTATVLGTISLLIVLALFFFNDTPEQIPTPENQTTTENKTETTLTGAQKGDLVTISYTLRFENGTIADTNIAELAQQAGLKTYSKGPSKYVLGQSGKVKGFDDAIIGLEITDKKEKIIQPSEKEEYRQINITQTENRFQSIPRHQSFPKEAFQKYFNKPAIVGDIVFNKQFQWKFKITNITETQIIAAMEVKEGEIYDLGNEYDSKVFQVYPEVISFYNLPEGNKTIETPYGIAEITGERQWITTTHKPTLHKSFEHTGNIGGIKTTWEVTEIKEDSFIIKRTDNLADKKLKLEIELIDLIKDVKTVREPALKINEAIEN